MHPSRLLVPLTGAAAAALLLTACGSSGGGGSSPSPTGSSSGSASGASGAVTSSPAASSPAGSSAAASSGSASGPATVAQLQKIVIQATDLPSTYKPTKPEADTNDGTTAKLQACTGVKGAPDSHKVHEAQSSDYQLGNTTISSAFSSYQSQSDVNADVALLKSPKINACLNSVLKASLATSLGTSAKITQSTFTLTPGSSGGPSNLAGTASGVIKFTTNGQQAAVYLGVAFVTGPQLDGTLSFVALNAPLDNSTSTSVLTAVANRAANP